MDIETFRAVLSEYLLPVGSIDLLQFILNALPSVVAIITVITTTIVQIHNSKQETKRFNEQMEQQKQLEHIRHDEERKSMVLQDRLKSEDKQRTDRITAYSSLMELLCRNEGGITPRKTVIEALGLSAKLLSLCAPTDRLAAEVHLLIQQINYTDSSRQELTEQELNSIRDCASSVALYLNDPNWGRVPAHKNSHPEQPPQ